MPALLDRITSAFAHRYPIERELGRGGMATVYLAHDPKHGRHVAMKVLRPELATSVGAERFLREIQVAARLTHPHILPLHDSGEIGGLLYYVMPYIDGESLRDRLQREHSSRSTRRSHRRGSRRRARLRAPQRNRPPGHQAGEHPARTTAARWSRTSASRARVSSPAPSGSPERPGRRHAGVHEPRAGRRASAASTAAATSTASAACCSRCLPASRRSRAGRPGRCSCSDSPRECAGAAHAAAGDSRGRSKRSVARDRPGAGRPVRHRRRAVLGAGRGGRARLRLGGGVHSGQPADGRRVDRRASLRQPERRPRERIFQRRDDCRDARRPGQPFGVGLRQLVVVSSSSACSSRAD